MAVCTVDQVREGLLENYDPSTLAVWQIYGEDTGDGGWNCKVDTPELGIFVGSYADAIEHALTITQFFTYGWGGRLWLALDLSDEQVKEYRRKATRLRKISKERQNLRHELGLDYDEWSEEVNG